MPPELSAALDAAGIKHETITISRENAQTMGPFPA